MKILITGGAGFLGQKLARALIADRHDVRILVRKPNMVADNSRAGTQIVGDLGNPGSLAEACEGIDWVFHTAGLISYNPTKNDLMYQTNVLGTRAITAAAKHAGVKRFIHTSSTAAIGISEDPLAPMTEDSPFNAGHLGLAYFTTKLEAEQEVLKQVANGLDAVIVNPGSLLGPGDTRRFEKGYVGLIYKYNPPFLFHGGINFVDIEDVVRGHLLAAEKGRTGERYLLGGENLSFADLIRRVNAVIGRPSPKRFVPKSAMGFVSTMLRGMNKVGIDIHMSPELVKQVCQWYLYVDSSKAKKELGYNPHRIDSAVSGTIQWLKDLGKIQ